jgi:hypothetical protein
VEKDRGTKRDGYRDITVKDRVGDDNTVITQIIYKCTMLYNV